MISDRRVKHGLTKHPLFRRWTNIKTRCYNRNSDYYHRYGGRGIVMCSEWKEDFKAYFDWCMSNGWEQGLDGDRIDNDGNYEPDNYRFVDKKVNQRNSSISKRWVVEGTEYLSSRQAARALGVSQSTIRNWCDGERRKKITLPPREGCSSRLAYS